VSLVCCLDNVAVSARVFLDSQCHFYNKPMVECGIEGLEGSQIVGNTKL
jgi:molybdopterin/thiamine biosynthesis adenylyltransferase